MCKSRLQLVVVLVVAVVLSAAAGVCRADTLWNVAGPADWNVAGNWSAGMPDSADLAIIKNDGTAYVDSDVGDVKGIYLSYNGGTGYLEIRPGADLAAVGSGAGQGQLALGYHYYSGGGYGHVLQTGGSVSLAHTFYAGGCLQLANSSDSGSEVGLYDMRGGTLSAAGGASIGGKGLGEFFQSGGDVSIGDMVLGRVAGDGKYVISGGSLALIGNMDVGRSTTGTALFKYVGNSATVGIGGDYLHGTAGVSSTTAFELDGAARTIIDVGGNVTLDSGTVEIGAAAGHSISVGTVFTLFQAGIAGNLSATGTTFDYDPLAWDVTVTEGLGGWVTAEYVVPEPSTLALLGMGLIGLLCYAWRKRK